MVIIMIMMIIMTTVMIMTLMIIIVIMIMVIMMALIIMMIIMMIISWQHNVDIMIPPHFFRIGTFGQRKCPIVRFIG
jgi:hypothetical protein